MQARAFIALGANLGNAVETITAAFTHLQRLTDAPLRKSSLWESEPIDCPPRSPKFVNAVAGLFLRTLEQLERQAFAAGCNVIDAAQQLIRLGILQ